MDNQSDMETSEKQDIESTDTNQVSKAPQQVGPLDPLVNEIKLLRDSFEDKYT